MPHLHRLDPSFYSHPSQITFITIRAIQNQAPFQHPPLARLVIDCLQAEQSRFPCRVYTYCLMPDHLHFLIRPVQAGQSVLPFAQSFKGRSTNACWKVGWQGKLWQARYYDHLVRSNESLERVSEYILFNPVRKGLVASPEEWAWAGKMNPMEEIFDEAVTE